MNTDENKSTNDNRQIGEDKIDSIQNAIQNAIQNLSNSKDIFSRNSNNYGVASILLLIIGSVIILDAASSYLKVSPDRINGVNYQTQRLEEFYKNEIIHKTDYLKNHLDKEKISCDEEITLLEKLENDMEIITRLKSPNQDVIKYTIEKIDEQMKNKKHACEKNKNAKKELKRHVNDLKKEDKILESVSYKLIPHQKNIVILISIFIGILYFIFSIVSLLYCLRYQRKIEVTKKKIDKYYGFSLAINQCDQLDIIEKNPENIVLKIIETLESTYTNAFSESNNTEFYNQLVKLRVPTKKSVEIRADLIKEIYKHAINNNK